MRDARTAGRANEGDSGFNPRHTLGVVSRSNGHRSPIQSLDHFAELAQTLAPLLEDAADAGAPKSADGLGFVGRGKGFTDTNPTGTARPGPAPVADTPSGRRAGHLIEEAELTLEDASGVIGNGLPPAGPAGVGQGRRERGRWSASDYARGLAAKDALIG
jgi:hypothetical protein